VRLKQDRYGSVVIFMSTAGRGAVEAKLVARPDGTVEQRSVGWITGSRAMTSASRTQTISARNYLQVAGVRPGIQPVTITFEVVGDSDLVEEFTALPTTSISRTKVSPFQVRITAPRSVVADSSGRVTVPFTVHIRGDRAAGRVSISATTDDEVLRVAALPRVVVNAHRHGRARLERTFTARLLSPGSHRLMLRVESNLNPAATVVEVRQQ
jgi:hypothetical protein